VRLELDPASGVCNRGLEVAAGNALVDSFRARPPVKARQARAMPVDPGLEALGFRKKEAGEEVALIKRERVLESPTMDGIHELMRIDLDLSGDAHALRLRVQPGIAQSLAQLVQLLAERMTRPFIVALWPEQRRCSFTGYFLLEREVQQDSTAKPLRGELFQLGVTGTAPQPAERRQLNRHARMVAAPGGRPQGFRGRVRPSLDPTPVWSHIFGRLVGQPPQVRAVRIHGVELPVAVPIGVKNDALPVG